MSRPHSSASLVFVVPLTRELVTAGRKGYTFVDVLEKDFHYFHPATGRWPSFPPAYIGFRYDGKLQSVRLVKKVVVVNDISKLNSRWNQTSAPHFVYTLGSPMKPTKAIRSTKEIFPRGGKVYCEIDTLLSGEFKTIKEAWEETKRRASHRVR
ncbi:MAG: hypothetical protein MPK06_01860 [Alphaproteobacteria bacterium]|nr:hypothetical protein [Alphaproteobacteria bacterium]MDA8005274.1 hypothetical protein [Alphaproteobacteria bacterium]MDA8012693.1 hypothetical protein [Alphaproteobacteria bacterium]